MSVLKCLVVDDEPIAHKILGDLIDDFDFLQLVGNADSAAKAKRCLAKKDFDLIFLDIEMPVKSGIDLLKEINQEAIVIFTTAYPDYALQGYELNVLDFLMKPISFDRFSKAANKALSYYNLKNDPRELLDRINGYFFIRCDQRIEKIFVDDVLYIEGLGNYVTVHTKERKYITYMTFKNIMQFLIPENFVRIHKSFLVPISKIKSINTNNIVLGELQLPLSRNYRDELLTRINSRLFKRS